MAIPFIPNDCWKNPFYVFLRTYCVFSFISRTRHVRQSLSTKSTSEFTRLGWKKNGIRCGKCIAVYLSVDFPGWFSDLACSRGVFSNRIILLIILPRNVFRMLSNLSVWKSPCPTSSVRFSQSLLEKVRSNFPGALGQLFKSPRSLTLSPLKSLSISRRLDRHSIFA